MALGLLRWQLDMSGQPQVWRISDILLDTHSVVSPGPSGHWDPHRENTYPPTHPALCLDRDRDWFPEKYRPKHHNYRHHHNLPLHPHHHQRYQPTTAITPPPLLSPPPSPPPPSSPPSLPPPSPSNHLLHHHHHQEHHHHATFPKSINTNSTPAPHPTPRHPSSFKTSVSLRPPCLPGASLLQAGGFCRWKLGDFSGPQRIIPRASRVDAWFWLETRGCGGSHPRVRTRMRGRGTQGTREALLAVRHAGVLQPDRGNPQVILLMVFVLHM